MKFSSLLSTSFLMLITELCQAEPVYGFIREAPVSSAPKAYLAQTPFNMGYVAIRASVDNPLNKGCISPNASNLWRKIFREESEVFLGARVWGFKGISGDKWIPIASYKWNNDGQFCSSVFQPDVLLVPLTPILASRDVSKPGIMEEPYIRIALRSKTGRSEKVSAAFTTLLQISSAYATGGAATTFAQLLDVAGGPAVKLVSTQVNEAFSSSSDQDFSLTFKWADLTKGTLEFPFKLSSVNKGMFDSVEDALNRLQTKNSAEVTELIRFKVTVDTRRSVFFADSDIQSGSKMFSVKQGDNVTTPLFVLNFPQDTSSGLAGTISSIQQLLSSEAPGLAKQLAGNDFSLACRKLVAKIFNAGFNRHDAALIIAAALDESKSDWRTNSGFIRACISDGDLLKDIATLTPPLVVYDFDAVKDIEHPQNHQPFVAKRHEAFLVEIRNALISKGFSRTEGLRSAFQGMDKNVALGGDVQNLIDDGPAEGDSPSRPLLPLEKLPVAGAGCFVSYFVSGSVHLGMAVLLSDSNGARRPYLLTMKLDQSKLTDQNVGKAIVGVWLIDLDLAPNQANVFGNATYDKAAMCHTSAPSGASGVIGKLKGIKG